jgi:hypothetical protein
MGNKKKFEFKGIKNLESKINKEISGMKKATMKGLLEAGMMLRLDMDTTSPTIPVDTNKLRASWYMTPENDTKLILGFSASYAVFVHENIDSTVNWGRVGAGPKFFESALKRNKKEILQIIKKNLE